MRGVIYPLAVLALAGCAEESEADQQASQDPDLAEQVRAANDASPPARELTPEPILDADSERNDLYGPACAFAPGTSMGARLVAREADAWIKLEGEMIRLAADPGSRELPGGIRSLYNGREYSLRLEMDAPETVEAPASPEGTMWLRDRQDRVVYTGTGAVSCSE